VYLALEKAQNRLVALKEVKIKEAISKKQYKEVVNEVEVMKKIQHPNIIRLYDSFIDN
jgi:serine/threonine protein kinase